MGTGEAQPILLWPDFFLYPQNGEPLSGWWRCLQCFYVFLSLLCWSIQG